jgi:glycosyltransferase involved in cell wall biosynthesis
MRLLFMLDRDFAEREHALVRRVEIGLLDEGVRLARCVPHACALGMPSGLIPQATYADTGPKIALAWRADRLFRGLERLMPSTSPGEEGMFDVVHAWGEDCWDLAAETAESDGADLVLEVYSADAVVHARRFERLWSSVLPEAGRCTLSVPSDELRQAAERAGVRWPVRVCPWGVFVPEEPRAIRRPGAPVSVCVIGDGGSAESASSVVALLEGVADLGRRREAMESAGAGTLPELLVFLDERLVTSSPDVWRYVQRLNLSGLVSVVADLEGRREPVLRSDMLALPEPTGVHRSILLDAMASGVTVIAAADESCPHLQHLSTAWVVEQPSARAWSDALERLLGDLELSVKLGESARQHAATHCLASNHVTAVLEMHQRLASGPAGFRAA